MRKLINAFHKIATYGAFISMLGMVAAVTIQVVARFMLPSAPNWTEEAARMFFIYLVAFGAAIGLRDNAFVRLEILRNYLGEKVQKRLQTFIFISVFLFSMAMIYYSFLFMQLGFREQSPSMEISMGFVFASLPLMMLSIALLSLEQIFFLLKPLQPHRKDQ